MYIISSLGVLTSKTHALRLDSWRSFLPLEATITLKCFVVGAGSKQAPGRLAFLPRPSIA